MRISKERANQIAHKLAEPKLKIYNELYEKFKKLVTAAYKKQIPKSVVDFAKHHKGWIEETVTIRIEGVGFRYEYVNASENVLMIEQGNTLQVTAELSKVLKPAQHAYEKAKDEHKKLVKEIEVALISLGVFSRIKEQFPEAAQYLPTSASMAVVVNLEGIRKQLKS